MRFVSAVLEFLKAVLGIGLVIALGVVLLHVLGVWLGLGIPIAYAVDFILVTAMSIPSAAWILLYPVLVGLVCWGADWFIRAVLHQIKLDYMAAGNSAGRTSAVMGSAPIAAMPLLAPVAVVAWLVLNQDGSRFASIVSAVTVAVAACGYFFLVRRALRVFAHGSPSSAMSSRTSGWGLDFTNDIPSHA